MVKKLLSALLALFILSLFPLTVLAGDLPTSTNTINWSTVEVYAYGSGTYKKSLGKVQEAGGQGAFGKEFTPSDGMGIQGFMLRLPRSSFPTTGKWKAQVSIQTGSTSLLLDRMYARGRVQRPNASDLSGQLPKIASDSIPPDFYTVTYNVNSQSLTSVEFFFPYAFPLYGTQRLNFSSVISFRDYESGNINNPVAPLPDASEQNQQLPIRSRIRLIIRRLWCRNRILSLTRLWIPLRLSATSCIPFGTSWRVNSQICITR